METRRTRRRGPLWSSEDSPIKRTDSVVSYETNSSGQPERRLQDVPSTPSDQNTNMDPPAIHENLEEGRTPKRMRSSPFTSPFNSPFGTSAHDYGIQQPPSPVNKGAGFIELTTPAQNQAQPGNPFGDSEIVKLRAELSQLRLDFDAEKQQSDILRSQFEVERCLNGFLRGQTIAEQSVNKTLTAKLTALEERMDLQEPTFVTLQNLKECLLTWLRDYLVNRAEGQSDAQL